MSEQSKQTVQEIQENFKRLTREADDASKKANTLGDKDLSTKIQKVKEGASEVVKHIEKRISE
jgi:uncharacterized protein YoxC